MQKELLIFITPTIVSTLEENDVNYNLEYLERLQEISLPIEEILFNWIKINIKKYFFIEVRSDKDSLYEQKTDHYRRFPNFEKLGSQDLHLFLLLPSSL